MTYMWIPKESIEVIYKLETPQHRSIYKNHLCFYILAISWKKIIRLNVGHGESDIHFLENVPFFENINKSYICIECIRGFPGGSDGKESACNVGDSGLTPGLGKSPGEGNRNPLQCSCLENPMDSGAWQATVHGVARSQHD